MMIVVSGYFSVSRCSYIENSVRSSLGIHYGPQHKTLTVPYMHVGTGHWETQLFEYLCGGCYWSEPEWAPHWRV